MVNLFQHQKNFLARRKRKALLVWETGTGKTITALQWAKSVPEIYPTTLIICPKALKKNWERNIVEHGGGYEYNILTKEEFKKAVKDGLLKEHTSIIIDEAHFFANYTSQMFKALMTYIKFYKVQNILGLTATPYMSTPWNIYSLGQIMGYNWSWFHFSQTFFVKVDMGSRMVPVVRDNAKDLLLPLIDQMADTVKLSDCVDVPSDNMVTEYFDMTPGQKTFIKKLYDPHFITKWTKSHQAMGGAVKQTEYDTDPFIRLDSNKFERCIQLGLEIDKPIIVCRYNAEIQMLAERFEKEGRGFHIINGATKDKQYILDLVNTMNKCVLLVNAACAEGWELPSCNTMIFYSYDFSLKNYIQMRGRIQRINNIQTCTYISLVVAGSVDEDVYKSVVVDKTDFHLEIYNGKI